MTRYVMVLMLMASRPNASAFWPFLLHYNQVVGSFVKTIVLFRLDKQKWTRQKTVVTRQKHASVSERMKGFSSVYMQLLSFGLFIIGLATVGGVINLPDPNFWLHVITEY